MKAPTTNILMYEDEKIFFWYQASGPCDIISVALHESPHLWTLLSCLICKAFGH